MKRNRMVNIDQRQNNLHLNLRYFPVCFNLFVALFLVTPCLAVDVQPCME